MTLYDLPPVTQFTLPHYIPQFPPVIEMLAMVMCRAEGAKDI